MEANDVIDQVTALPVDSVVYRARHGREKVVDATERSHALLLAVESYGLTRAERLALAWYCCFLAGGGSLAEHYRTMLLDEKASDGAALVDLLHRIETSGLDGLRAGRFKSMLSFVRKLMLNLADGNEAEVKKLRAAALDTPDIVTLAQLIGFLSYQVRVVSGLRAILAGESR